MPGNEERCLTESSQKKTALSGASLFIFGHSSTFESLKSASLAFQVSRIPYGLMNLSLHWSSEKAKVGFWRKFGFTV